MFGCLEGWSWTLFFTPSYQTTNSSLACKVWMYLVLQCCLQLFPCFWGMNVSCIALWPPTLPLLEKWMSLVLHCGLQLFPCLRSECLLYCTCIMASNSSLACEVWMSLVLHCGHLLFPCLRSECLLYCTVASNSSLAWEVNVSCIALWSPTLPLLEKWMSLVLHCGLLLSPCLRSECLLNCIVVSYSPLAWEVNVSCIVLVLWPPTLPLLVRYECLLYCIALWSPTLPLLVRYECLLYCTCIVASNSSLACEVWMSLVLYCTVVSYSSLACEVWMSLVLHLYCGLQLFPCLWGMNVSCIVLVLWPPTLPLLVRYECLLYCTCTVASYSSLACEVWMSLVLYCTVVSNSSLACEVWMSLVLYLYCGLLLFPCLWGMNVSCIVLHCGLQLFSCLWGMNVSCILLCSACITLFGCLVRIDLRNIHPGITLTV